MVKRKHRAAVGAAARATLESVGIALGQDFHTLDREQVERLHAIAHELRYQRPKNANGSRTRYFHERLQRRALWS